MEQANDRRIVRDLARQVAEIMARPEQAQKRDLWRRHNSLKRTRPLVLSLGMPYVSEVVPEESLQCVDPLCRLLERNFRHMQLQDRIGDDMVIEPWVLSRPIYRHPVSAECRWGPPIRFSERTEKRGSFAFRPSIVEERDIEKMVFPRHEIDEEATALELDRTRELVGDIVPVYGDRGPFYRGWVADISTDIARLLGLEEFMVYMLDRPAWLHKILGFMRDGILAAQEQAEQAGDWRLCHHANQAQAYAEELADPAGESRPVKRSELWCFFASQETTCVSPAMFEEFMLQYQLPIIEKFGLSAYGCCEDNLRKLPLIKRIRNLRRISVTPWMDLGKSVEMIGRDYVISWRPNPAEVICTGLNRERVKRITREGLERAKGCSIDITIKDHETLPDGFDSLVECVKIMKDIAAEYA